MAKSIIQEDKSYCYLCGMNRNLEPLEEHHIFNGSNRKWSEKYGLKVYLHGCKCHRLGPDSVHVNAEIRETLQDEAQRIAMKHYKWSIDDFRNIFGRNYLKGED